MARKTIPPPTLDQAVAWLRDHQFDVTPEPAGAFRVQKHGCVAVLTSGLSALKEKSAVFNLRPHILIAGQPARILDRGYQKFLHVPGLPDRTATAAHLQALHLFQEELAQAIGHDQIYNEALGTVSDTYVYDRVKGRADIRP
jgi:hypothetical protein